ncbi:MAG TPA: DUF362 domain-containing protein [bacterium]|nr:DUF362 domain-containing protein [bacterium]
MSQVALVSCDKYDLARVMAALRRSLDLLGGLAGIIKPGERVLIKVSMLRAAKPADAVTTHPMVAVGLALLLREIGATPVIGDSCGGADYGFSEQALIETGIKPLADAHGIETVLFETAGSVITPVVNGKFLREIPVSKAVLAADAVISMPKLKTHIETLMTGAVKNMLGCLPGAGKLLIHRTAPSPYDLGQALLDIYSAVRPRLCVMDGIVAMSGNGPSRGAPHKVGALLASTDGVALDHVAARLIGYKPRLIPTILDAKERGLGETDEAAIEILGEALADLKPVDFALCSNTMMRAMPKFLLRILNRWFFTVRPEWNDAGCIRCGLCERSCPVGAIVIADDKLTIDHKKCIDCFCCFELCPEKGIKVRKSFLVKILSG